MSAKGGRRKLRYNFTLDKNTVERLDVMSDELELSRSELIDRAVKAYYQAMLKHGKITISK